MTDHPTLARLRVTAARAGAGLVLALGLAACAAIYPPSRPSPAAPVVIIAAPPVPIPSPPPAPEATTSPVADAPPITAVPVLPLPPDEVPATPPLPPAIAVDPALPPTVDAAPGEQVRRPERRPSGAPLLVALVLPLDTPAFARAADAVRAGFLAAAGSTGNEKDALVIGHGEDGVLAAFEIAREAGADVIVGPLVRDDVKAVAQLALDLPFTVALNQLEEGIASPPQLYTFSLGVEADARLIARRLRTDAARNVAVVGASTPLMRRFASAFAADWLLAGGSIPTAYRFDPASDVLRSMRREILRNAPDGLLLAVDSATATLAKPYLGTIPAYASGLVFEQETQAVMRDLDGLRLVEIPWVVTPFAPQFANLPRREFTSYSLTRLYALGLDAYRVAQAFRNGEPQRFSMEGATGQVTLIEGRQFSREGRLAVFRAGQLAPLDGPQ